MVESRLDLTQVPRIKQLLDVLSPTELRDVQQLLKVPVNVSTVGLDAPPSVPSAQDDEFSLTVLDPKWIVTFAGIPPTYDVNSTLKSNFLAIFNAGNTAVRITQPFAPGAADFSFTYKVNANPLGNYEGIFFWSC